jgi:hypothetical protein
MPDRILAGLCRVLDNLPVSSIDLQLMPDFCGSGQMPKLERLKIVWLTCHEIHDFGLIPRECVQHAKNEKHSGLLISILNFQ